MLTEAWKFYQKIHLSTFIYQQFSTQFLLKLTIQSQWRDQKPSSTTLLQWWGLKCRKSWGLHFPQDMVSYQFHALQAEKENPEHCISSYRGCRVQTLSSCCATQASSSSCFLSQPFCHFGLHSFLFQIYPL